MTYTYNKEYLKKYQKERSKVKAVRYTNKNARRIESYCKYKNMGFGELVNMLIEKQIKEDGWIYTEEE